MARVSSRTIAALRVQIDAQIQLNITTDEVDGEVVLLRLPDVDAIAGVCDYPPLPALMAAAMTWAPNSMASAFQLTLFLEAVVKAGRSLPIERWQAGSILAIEVIFMFKAAFRPLQSLYKGRRVAIIRDNSRWNCTAPPVNLAQAAFHELLALRNELAEVIVDLESALHSLAAAEVLINRKTVAGSRMLPHDVLALNGAASGMNRHAKPGSPLANLLHHVACTAVYALYTDRNENALSYLFQTALPVATDGKRYASTARTISNKFFDFFPPPCHVDACEFRELADTVQYMIGMITAHVMAGDYQPFISERFRTIHFISGRISTTV